LSKEGKEGKAAKGWERGEREALGGYCAKKKMNPNPSSKLGPGYSRNNQIFFRHFHFFISFIY
jgi:hypothetical protein